MRRFECKVWRTATVGVIASLQEDIDVLEAAGMILSAQAYYLFGATGQTRARSRLAIDLVMPAVSELGFTSAATFGEVFERGVEWGLELTPWEATLDCRRQYADQPITRESIPFAMKPFFGTNRAPHVLALSHEEGFPQTLGSIAVAAKARIRPHKRIIFVQPRT